MAKPIQHNAFDTVEESAWGAVKGAVVGAVASFAVGAAIVGVVGLVGVAIVGAPIVGSAGVIAGAAAIGGAATAFVGGTLATLGGALIGLAKGANKASKENAAYTAKMREAQMTPQAQLIEAQNAAMQQGYMAAAQQLESKAGEIYNAGVNAGRQEVTEHLKADQAKAGSHAAGLQKNDSHAAMIESQKQAKAAAGQALGA